IEPKMLIEALNEEGWVIVMQEELNQFERNKVWSLVPVPHGFRQEKEIDYDETFAPVTRLEAIRIFLAFAAYMGFMVCQMDVNSAFLNVKLSKEVFIQQPPGFESSEFPNYHKFIRGTIDSTLFTNKTKSDVIIVQIDVDDIIFSALVKCPILPLNNLGPDESGVSVNETLFRGMIGSLMYLTASRPDIQFSTCLCARKSTFGGFQILGGKLACWSAKKQSSMAMSSAEVEYNMIAVEHFPQKEEFHSTRRGKGPSCVIVSLLGFNKTTISLHSSIPQGILVYNRSCRQHHFFSLSNVDETLSFDRAVLATITTLNYTKNFVSLPSHNVVLEAIAILGLTDEKRPKMTYEDLAFSTPLRLKYFTPAWKILMTYIVKFAKLLAGGKNGRDKNIYYTRFLSLIFEYLLQENYMNDELDKMKGFHITDETFKPSIISELHFKGFNKTTISLHSSIPQGILVYNRSCRQHHFFSLSNVDETLSFDRAVLATITTLNYTKNFVSLPSHNVVLEAIAILGLTDEKRPKMTYEDLAFSTPLRLKYFTPAWKILMTYIVKCLGGNQGRKAISWWKEWQRQEHLLHKGFHITDETFKPSIISEVHLTSYIRRVSNIPEQPLTTTSDDAGEDAGDKSLFGTSVNPVSQPTTKTNKRLKKKKSPPSSKPKAFESVKDINPSQASESQPADKLEVPVDTTTSLDASKHKKKIVKEVEPTVEGKAADGEMTLLEKELSAMDEDSNLGSIPEDDMGSLSGSQTSSTEEDDNQSLHKELLKSKERDADNIIKEMDNLDASVDKPYQSDPLGHLRDELSNLITKLISKSLKDERPQMISEAVHQILPHIKKNFRTFNKYEATRFVMLQKAITKTLMKKVRLKIKREVQKGMGSVKGQLEEYKTQVNQTSKKIQRDEIKDYKLSMLGFDPPCSIRDIRTKQLGLSEWIEVHALASKQKGKDYDALLKSLRAKFKWLKTLAGDLGFLPQPELSAYPITPAERKRKRPSEMIEQVFVKDNIRVDGMERNLNPSRRVVGEFEFHLSTTPQLITTQQAIQRNTPEAEDMYKKLEFKIEAKDDAAEAKRTVKENLNGFGM
nr:hypothetical protein [Tanacetum cinerariifolium]